MNFVPARGGAVSNTHTNTHMKMMNRRQTARRGGSRLIDGQKQRPFNATVITILTNRSGGTNNQPSHIQKHSVKIFKKEKIYSFTTTSTYMHMHACQSFPLAQQSAVLNGAATDLVDSNSTDWLAGWLVAWYCLHVVYIFAGCCCCCVQGD